ncbi:LOB domain-containing protein 4 [Selaginella moellendorffii]|nr:LOB domain-containing protein 4 [Selaginella moellendorffii]|eukprot:XP_002985907.2 LOB domain-containing protein 4 [Selaginella moellendorffii]
MSPSGLSPCAACKLLRRRCAQDCIFAPYFPPDEPQKFAFVHKVFGASNVSKMLQDLPLHQRGDAVSSMVYEANARVRDPVYGCVGAISALHQQIAQLQTQLAISQAENVCLRMQHSAMVTNIVGQNHSVSSATTAATTITSESIKISPASSPPAAPSSPDRESHHFRGIVALEATGPLWTTC